MVAAGPGPVCALRLAAAHEGYTSQAQGGVAGVPGQVLLAVAALDVQQVEVQVLHMELLTPAGGSWVCGGQMDMVQVGMFFQLFETPPPIASVAGRCRAASWGGGGKSRHLGACFVHFSADRCGCYSTAILLRWRHHRHSECHGGGSGN